MSQLCATGLEGQPTTGNHNGRPPLGANLDVLPLRIPRTGGSDHSLKFIEDILQFLPTYRIYRHSVPH